MHDDIEISSVDHGEQLASRALFGRIPCFENLCDSSHISIRQMQRWRKVHIRAPSFDQRRHVAFKRQDVFGFLVVVQRELVKMLLSTDKHRTVGDILPFDNWFEMWLSGWQLKIVTIPRKLCGMVERLEV